MPERGGIAGLLDAALLGAATGARTFAAPAALALRGRLGGRRGRVVFVALATGELVGDKHPDVPPRTEPAALGARIVSGAFSGHRVAGRSGALVGGGTAAAATFATHRARAVLSERLPLPDAVVAVAEDCVVLCLVALATRER